MIGQYLMGCSMGKLVLGTGYWVLGLKVIGLTTWWDDSGSNGEVKGNRLKNTIHRKVAPVPSSRGG